MPLVNFSNVDFDEIKESLKDYLRANSNFTDYDFEGNAMHVTLQYFIIGIDVPEQELTFALEPTR